MKRTMAAAPSRAVGFSWVLLALAAALVLGTALVPGAEASKKGKNTIASVKDRVQVQRDLCEAIGGGTLEVRTLPSGTKITYCEGGTEDGTRCKHTEKVTTCRQTLTRQPAAGTTAPPTGGVAQDPTGGAHPGTSAVSPGGEADPDGGNPEQPPIQ